MDFSDAGALFDAYVDWPRRLGREIPFLKDHLSRAGARRVADVACGTGRHAVALAREGFRITGIDPDERFLDEARRAAREAGAVVDWIAASFEEMPFSFTDADDPFDGVLCLGNSISLVPPDRLTATFCAIAALLAENGTAIVHTINYPMLARRPADPWGPVRELSDGTLLLKGFVPRGDDPWDALFVALGKKEKGWVRETSRFSLHPHSRNRIEKAGRKAGLALEAVHGGFAGEEPDQPSAADLLYVFTR